MDGLRRLALQALDDFVEFGSNLGEYGTVEVFSPAGSEPKLVLGNITSVVDWMRSGAKDNNDGDATYHLKILRMPYTKDNAIPMTRDLFKDLFQSTEINAIALDLLLRGDLGTYIWTSTASNDSKSHISCVVSDATGTIMWYFHPQSGTIRGLSRERWAGSLQIWQSNLESFIEMNGHPLYPLLALGQQAVKRYRKKVIDKVKQVQRIAWSTGYYPWSQLSRDWDEEKPPVLGDLSVEAGQVAFALNDVSAELSLWKSWLQIGVESAGNWPSMIPADRRDTFLQRQNEIISAIGTTQHQLENLLVRSIQWRDDAKTVMSVLFNLIAKADANVSMEVAKDSRTIALHARHDSSSMKTIAFMTMAFLPATFFATFFAMPPLQHLKLWVYWVTTLPVTFLVFVTWYLVIKRLEFLRRFES